MFIYIYEYDIDMSDISTKHTTQNIYIQFNNRTQILST